MNLRKIIGRVTGGAILASAITLGVGSGLAVAAGTGGYGSLPIPSNPPGFGTVLQTQPVTPGQQLGPITGTIDGVNYSITVPANTFSSSTDSLELVVTTCSLSSVGSAGFAGYSAYACIGVAVYDLTTNQKVNGPFNPPFTLTLSGNILAPSANLLVTYDATNNTWVQLPSQATSVTVSIAQDPDFALLAQTSTPSSTIAGATSPQTGKPFVGEAIGAGVLLIAGAGTAILLIKSRKRQSA